MPGAESLHKELDEGDRTLSLEFNLGDEKVPHTYPEDPLFVAPDQSVGDVLRLLKAESSGCALVLNDGDVSDEGELLGIFTERDALRVMTEEHDLSAPVSSIMTERPVSVTPNASVGEAIQKMVDGGYRHLPLVDGSGSASGVVAVHGLVHFLVDHFPSTIYNLPPRPDAAPTEREGA